MRWGNVETKNYANFHLFSINTDVIIKNQSAAITYARWRTQQLSPKLARKRKERATNYRNSTLAHVHSNLFLREIQIAFQFSFTCLLFSFFLFLDTRFVVDVLRNAFLMLHHRWQPFQERICNSVFYRRFIILEACAWRWYICKPRKMKHWRVINKTFWL